MFQNVQLLPLTIAENVSSGTKENMDREKVINCLKLAGLWEKIEDFPDKKIPRLGKGYRKMQSGFPVESSKSFGWPGLFIRRRLC